MSQRNFTAGRRPRRRAAIPHIEGLEARSLLSTAQVPAPGAGPRYVPGEVLIQFKPGVADAARTEARGHVEATLAETIATGPIQDAGQGALERVSLPAARSVEASIRALRANPNVAFA